MWKRFLFQRIQHAFIMIRYDIRSSKNDSLLKRTKVIIKMLYAFSHANDICQICFLLEAICNELRIMLQNNQWEQAYDFVDAIHCLPSVVVRSRYRIPVSYINIYIMPYCKKWQHEFDTVIKKIAINAISPG